MGRALPSEFESLAQPDDLRCEPLAARRRRDLAPIELGGGSICRQVASSVRIGRRRSARSVASAAVLSNCTLRPPSFTPRALAAATPSLVRSLINTLDDSKALLSGEPGDCRVLRLKA
jgi:hypothetical protein